MSFKRTFGSIDTDEDNASKKQKIIKPVRACSSCPIRGARRILKCKEFSYENFKTFEIETLPVSEKELNRVYNILNDRRRVSRMNPLRDAVVFRFLDEIMLNTVYAVSLMYKAQYKIEIEAKLKAKYEAKRKGKLKAMREGWSKRLPKTEAELQSQLDAEYRKEFSGLLNERDKLGPKYNVRSKILEEDKNSKSDWTILYNGEIMMPVSLHTKDLKRAVAKAICQLWSVRRLHRRKGINLGNTMYSIATTMSKALPIKAIFNERDQCIEVQRGPILELDMQKPNWEKPVMLERFSRLMGYIMWATDTLVQKYKAQL